MGKGEKWFGRLVWIGILLNLSFALPAMFAPDMLLAGLDLPPEASMLWLQNVGMLLLSLCIFYSPSAIAPSRHPTHTKFVVLSRLIASVFWFILLRQAGAPEVIRPLWLTDLTLGVLLAILLNFALLPEDRASLHGARHLDGRERPAELVAAALADQHPGLHERPHALLEEEGIALGPLDEEALERAQVGAASEQ